MSVRKYNFEIYLVDILSYLQNQQNQNIKAQDSVYEGVS